MNEHDPLRDELDRLPRAIEPPHDLWPRIEARIRSGATGANDAPAKVTPLRAAWRSWSRQMLAAAAVVVVFLAGWGVAVLREGHDVRPRDVAAPLPARTGEALTDYEKAEAELLATLEGSGIAPETAELIRRNVAAMDAAVGDIRTALADDPDDPHLQKQLANEVSRRQHLLRRIAAIQIAGLQLGGEE
jgi:hypothetical protein